MTMKRIIKVCSLILCLFGVMTLTACNNGNTEVNIDNLERVEMSGSGGGDIWRVPEASILADLSSHVFRGEVLSSRVEQFTMYQPREARVEWLEARGRPEESIHIARYYEVIRDPATFVMTIYQVEVSEVFRELDVFHDTQIAVGDIIEVARFGGAYGGHYYFVDGGFELEYGAEYVLFLERHWELPNFFYTLSNLQGAHHVPNVIASDEDLVEYGNISLELEAAADEDFGLILTVEDLIDIAEENGLLEHEDKLDDDEPEEEGVYGDGIDDEEENDAEIEEIEDSDE